MTQATAVDRLIGRDAEMRRLRSALCDRRSQLLWGPVDAGKSFLMQKTIADLSEAERQKCICWTGAARRRQLVEKLICELYFAGDAFVQKKVHADGFSSASLDTWIREQSALRLRGILFTSCERGQYRIVLDHLPLPSYAMAGMLKEIMYRTKTPVYLTGNGYSQAEIGGAWSLYWTDEYRIRVGPLQEARARELLETCINDCGLSALDLSSFREAVLHLSGLLPGSIAKMCRLAADPRYHYGNQVKIKLVHVDYLLQTNRCASDASHMS